MKRLWKALADSPTARRWKKDKALLTRARRFVVACAALIAFLAVLFSGTDRVIDGPLTLGSAFSGLLALTGFMFTARTFITFKLNELVYGTDNYRQYVEDLKKDGAHSDPLYAPLKSLDSTLGRTCLYCLFALFCLAAFALLPKEVGKGASLVERFILHQAGGVGEPITVMFAVYQVFAAAVYSAVLIAIVRVFWCIMRVNENIKSIIDHWEKTYIEKGRQGKLAK